MTTSEIKRIDYAEARRAFNEHEPIPDGSYYYEDNFNDGCHACLIGALSIHLAGRRRAPGKDEMYQALELVGFNFSYLAGLDHGFSLDLTPDGDDDPSYRAGCEDGRAMRHYLLHDEE